MPIRPISDRFPDGAALANAAVLLAPKKRVRRLSPQMVVNLNTSRRQRYQDDPEYAEQIRNARRMAYRKRRRLYLSNCLRSLSYCDNLAHTQRVILPDQTERDWPVMTIPVMAQALDRTYPGVHRWIQNGLLPAPVLMTASGGHQAYHLKEVKEIVVVIGRHGQKFAYLRADHVGTIKQLKAAVAAARQQIGI